MQFGYVATAKSLAIDFTGFQTSPFLMPCICLSQIILIISYPLNMRQALLKNFHSVSRLTNYRRKVEGSPHETSFTAKHEKGIFPAKSSLLRDPSLKSEGSYAKGINCIYSWSYSNESRKSLFPLVQRLINSWRFGL